MNKKFVLPLALGFMMTLGAGSVLASPECPPQPECANVCFNKECPKSPEFEKRRAEFEKRRAEFKKLSPQEREQKMKEMQQKRIQEFDKKLNLTDEQKAKAKEIRLKGHEQMKPVMDKIIEKRKEIEAVKRSRIAPQEQEKQIKALRAQMKPLKQKADKLRKQNMAEFEKILTPEQKATLNEMKKAHDKHRGPKPHCDKKLRKAPPKY